MILGEEAKNQGMTFFYCKDSNAFIDLLGIVSKNYSKSLLFLEDIDEVSSGEDRDHAINELLNTLDGVQTKGKDIKVLFTTNHHGRINPALRRPGRLDLIARFENPTEDTRAKIYEVYLKDTENLEEMDYESLSKATPDCSGAFIAEICKRAIRLAQLNGGITNDIVVAAINSIRDHLDLMTEPVEGGNGLEKAFDFIATRIAEKCSGIDVGDMVGDISSQINGTLTNVHRDLSKKITGAATDIRMDVEKTDKKVNTIQPQVKEIYDATV